MSLSLKALPPLASFSLSGAPLSKLPPLGRSNLGSQVSFARLTVSEEPLHGVIGDLSPDKAGPIVSDLGSSQSALAQEVVSVESQSEKIDTSFSVPNSSSSCLHISSKSRSPELSAAFAIRPEDIISPENRVHFLKRDEPAQFLNYRRGIVQESRPEVGLSVFL